MKGTCVQGVVIQPGTGRDLILQPCRVGEFGLTLRHGIPWYLGIDQSTSCTGICLKSADRKFLILLDVIRDKSMMREDFYRDLHRIIKNFSVDQDFMIVANEKPVPSAKRYTHDVLLELLGRLNAWIDDMPEFEGAQHGQVFPQTWKSLVMDKTKGKGRMNIKSEIAADLVDKYPELKYYYNFHHTGDYDSFDALGILDGYIAYAFTPDGYPQIHGTIEKRHVSLVLYDWVDFTNDFTYEENIRNALGDNISVFEPYILHYNQRYSLYENIRMASSNFDCVATILPESQLQQFRWKFGIDVDEHEKAMMAVILNRGKHSAGLVKSAKNVYTWNEEVFGD